MNYRLSFDIESGTTKASLVRLAADGTYRHSEGTILFGEEIPVLLGHCLKASPERCISEELISKVEAAVESLILNGFFLRLFRPGTASVLFGQLPSATAGPSEGASASNSPQ